MKQYLLSVCYPAGGSPASARGTQEDWDDGRDGAPARKCSLPVVWGFQWRTACLQFGNGFFRHDNGEDSPEPSGPRLLRARSKIGRHLPLCRCRPSDGCGCSGLERPPRAHDHSD